MGLFRLTWTFRDGQGARFSEVFYKQGTTIADVGLTPNSAVVNKRLAFLHYRGRLLTIRIANVLVARETIPISINRSGLSGSILLGSLPANSGEAAIFNLVCATKPARRKIWLRGLSEDDVFMTIGNDFGEMKPTFKTATDEWMTAMQTAQFVIASRKKPLVQPNEPFKRLITAVAQAANPRYTVLTLATPYLDQGTNRLVVGGMDPRAYYGINGQHDVISTAGSTVTIRYKLALPSGSYTIDNGYVYPLIYETDTFINKPVSGFAYLMTRQTKKEAISSRGARRVGRLKG